MARFDFARSGCSTAHRFALAAFLVEHNQPRPFRLILTGPHTAQTPVRASTSFKVSECRGGVGVVEVMCHILTDHSDNEPPGVLIRTHMAQRVSPGTTA